MLDNRLLPPSKRRLTPYRREYLTIAMVERRRQMKSRAVAYKGGRCQKCGYKKCQAAFEFHHPDPLEKDFNISRFGTKSFERLKPELDKTILLCANCHREVHDEINVASLRVRKSKFDRVPKPARGARSHKK